jgi:ribonucleoside-diphosphate reductase subunit M1
MDRNTFLTTLESRLVEYGCGKEDLERIYSKIQSRVPEKMDSLHDLVVQCLSSECHRFETYDRLAVRFLSQELADGAPFSFLEVVRKIQANQNINGDPKPLLAAEFYEFIEQHAEQVEAVFTETLRETEHFPVSTFGWKTLFRSYLTRTHKGVVERPDHLWYRVALFLHRDDWDRVRSSFVGLRQGNFIHATPTLFSAGMSRPQMASCFSASTLVWTEKGARPIAQVQIGDRVWTHQQRWKTVLQTHKNERGDRGMVSLTFCGLSEPLEATVDHPFFVWNCLSKSYQWKKVDDMRPGDWVAQGDGGIGTHFRRHTLNGLLYSLKILSSQTKKGPVVVIRGSQWPAVKKLWSEFRVSVHVEDAKDSNDKILNIDKIHFWLPVRVDHDYMGLEKKALAYFLRGVRMTNLYNSFTREYTFLPSLWEMAKCKGFRTVKTPAGNMQILEPWDLLDFLQVGRTTKGGRWAVRLWSKTLLSNPDNDVYTLGVEDDHSYVAGGVVVKNCFLVGTEDSVQGIYQTLADAAQISKWAGGLGIHVSDVRGKNSYIYGTNGTSNGILPMLKVFNNTARYIDQGGGKRNGAFAMYLEPWHSDILSFLEAKRNTGSEEERARDLFYALWIPDLFMRCVEEGRDWYLMSPSECPDLAHVWGDAFETLYQQYVDEGKYTQKISARDVWKEITRSQLETGTPYMLYKDSCNRRSNQQNLGTIRSSNLCCEIIEYSDAHEYAVCNLASIALPSCLRPHSLGGGPLDIWVYGKPDCVYCKMLKGALNDAHLPFVYRDPSDDLTKEETARLVGKKTVPMVYVQNEYVGGWEEMWKRYLSPEFDWERLGAITEQLVENLNLVIDKNAYPLEKCRISNTKHRPIGIGVQGLADVFFRMLLPYDSPEARQLNRDIFECMYFHALQASHRVAVRDGPYSSFQGSPLSKGMFHFEMLEKDRPSSLSGKWDWETLRTNIVRDGTRNSLLLAPMPTASTSQILGNTESFEPLTSNLYLRRTSAGEFYVCNHMLRRFLQWIGRWDNDMIEKLIIFKGSVQSLDIPLKPVFRTVWEISQKSLIDMAADRQFFIDQSQSFNLYLQDADMEKLNKMHFYGWKKGLKTGSYYVRSRASLSSQNFTIDPLKEKEEKETCLSCSA